MLGLGKNDKGDTIVEVLFGVAIFSLIAVGSMMIMSQGAATAQRALEISLVREEINSQAETLRFLNSSYISSYRAGATYPSSSLAGQWIQIQSMAVSNVTPFGGLSSCPATLPTNSFILNARTAKYVSGNVMSPATTYSQVVYNTANSVSAAEGIWINAERSSDTKVNNTLPDPSNKLGYIDFHIRACWSSPGQSTPVTLGTIVRLYEPRP
jgi:type II secretory pathway pseudopilin PulG